MTKLETTRKRKRKVSAPEATFGVRHQPEQESPPKNTQQGETREKLEKLSDNPDYGEPPRPMKTQEPRSEDH